MDERYIYTNFMDRYPLISTPYMDAALAYFPFKFRLRFITTHTRLYGLDTVDQSQLGIDLLYTGGPPEELQMFGSPKELHNEVLEFMDFQGNMRQFRMEPCAPYNHQLRFYDDHEGTGKKYICKNDILMYIQNKLMAKEEKLQLQVTVQMLAYFLKYKEKNLGSAVEFVEFGEKEAKYLDKELDQIVKDMDSHPGPIQTDWKTNFVRLKLLLPSEITKERMNVTLETLKLMYDETEYEPLQLAKMAGALFLHYCKVMFVEIEKIIKERPQWFNLNAKVNRKLLPSGPIIRLFLDEHSSFVLSRELASALKLTSYNEDETDIMDTVSLESAKSICTAHKAQVTFVNIPIRRAKQRAVPIPSGTGNVCKMAADVLLESLRDVIFQFGAFEASNKHRVWALDELLKDFELIFDPEIDSVYMFTNTRMIDIELKVAVKLVKNGWPVDINSVKTNGFTLNDLKKEMKRLGLDKFFGDVMNYAESVYLNVVSKKKEKNLRPCDMYDAIENCVLISFFKKYTKLAHFLHKQKSCHRIYGYQCPKCEDQKKNPKEISVLPTTIPVIRHDKKALKELFEPPKDEDEMDKSTPGKIGKLAPKSSNETKVLAPRDEKNVENVSNPIEEFPEVLEAWRISDDTEYSENSNDENVSPNDIKTQSPTNAKSGKVKTTRPLVPIQPKLTPKDVTIRCVPKPEETNSKDSNKESKCCSDCFHNSEKCDRANEKLKTSTKKEAEMRKDKLAMEKELKELKQKDPVKMDVLEKIYLEKLNKAEEQLKVIKITDNENQEKSEILKSTIERQQKEIEAAKMATIEKEKVKNELRGLHEMLTAENNRLDKEEEEKDKIMKQLLENLKTLNTSKWE